MSKRLLYGTDRLREPYLLGVQRGPRGQPLRWPPGAQAPVVGPNFPTGATSIFGSWESAIPQMGGWLILTLFQQLRQLRDIRSNVSQGRHQSCSCDGMGGGALSGVLQNDTFNRPPSWWCLTSGHVLAGQFAGQTGCKCEQNGKAGMIHRPAKWKGK